MLALVSNAAEVADLLKVSALFRQDWVFRALHMSGAFLEAGNSDERGWDRG